jgi:hypothetical protein
MSSLRDPAILFFIFGIFAGLIKSNLTIPTHLPIFIAVSVNGTGFKRRLCTESFRIKFTNHQ